MQLVEARAGAEVLLMIAEMWAAAVSFF